MRYVNKGNGMSESKLRGGFVCVTLAMHEKGEKWSASHRLEFGQATMFVTRNLEK